MPFNANAANRHHVPKQKRQVTNWPQYDASLRLRGSLMVWFSPVAVAGGHAEDRTTPGGQAHYSTLAILMGLRLRAVFYLALRQTAIGRFKQVIGGGLRFQTVARQNTKNAVAIYVLNRLLDFGRPSSVRVM